ncbi:hypothetical protein AB0K20_29000 [Micromonospora matsumotoense]
MSRGKAMKRNAVDETPVAQGGNGNDDGPSGMRTRLGRHGQRYWR